MIFGCSDVWLLQLLGDGWRNVAAAAGEEEAEGRDWTPVRAVEDEEEGMEGVTGGGLDRPSEQEGPTAERRRVWRRGTHG